jgi:hypothetical protein
MAIDKVVSASITDSSVTSAKVAAGVLHKWRYEYSSKRNNF